MTTSNRFLITVLSACNFVIGMGAFLVIGLVTPLSDDLGATPSAVGFLLTAYALGYAVLSPLLVSTTGALGRRRVLAMGLALFALAAVLSALASDMTTLYVARVIAAAGAGLYTPVAAAVAAGLSAPSERGRALAAVFFGLTLAQVAGVPVGSWIAYTYGWRMAFWLVALLALAGLWLVWTRVPKGLSFQPVQLRDLGNVLLDAVMMGAVLFTASFLAAIYIVFTFITPLLTQSMGYGRDGISAALLVFGIGAVVGNLLGGRLTDRIGAVQTLMVLCLGQIVLMPVFSALPFNAVPLFALMLVWSVFCWSFMAAQQVRLLALAPEQASVVLALNAAAIYVGAAVGSALGGVVLDRMGLLALGAAGGIAALGALGHLLWSHRAVKLAGR